MEFLRRSKDRPYRLGVLPGTFNPVTVAHLALAEATPVNGLAGATAGATESSAAAGSGEGPVPGTEPVAGAGAGQTKRRRGQQPGGPGPKRQRRLHLPEETTHHLLSEAERT